MAIKCHSGFVHYNMFHNNHCHGGGNNYGSIFNIEHNCGGGTNFWGGLGAGLGFGLGGMFSGLFGNFMGGFGNMFGGFGMGNMFGGLGNMFGGFGGFGMGGFGSPFGGGWGSGWGDGLSGLFGGKDKSDKTDKSDKDSKTRTSTEETTTLTDKDYSEINDLHTKANSFIGKKATPENLKEVEALLDEVDDYDLEDENLSPENKTQIENIKAQLEALQKEYSTTLGTTPKDTAAEQAGQPQGATDTGAEVGEVAEQPQGSTGTEAGANGNTTPTLKIDGEDVALDKLTPEQIGKLSKEQIDSLKPNQAKDLLEKLGLFCKDNSGRDSVKATTSLNALRLVEKAGLPVALAHNKALDNKTGANVDPYLDGMVSKIEYNETTQIITYHLEDENGIYKIECKAGSTKIETKNLIKNKTQKYKSFTPTTYEIKTDEAPYAVRDGLPASVTSV